MTREQEVRQVTYSRLIYTYRYAHIVHIYLCVHVCMPVCVPFLHIINLRERLDCKFRERSSYCILCDFVLQILCIPNSIVLYWFFFLITASDNQPDIQNEMFSSWMYVIRSIHEILNILVLVSNQRIFTI